MKYFKSILIIAVVFIAGGSIGWVIFSDVPNLNSYESHSGLSLSTARQTTSESNLKVTFLGVTSLLFDDGETAFMTDGFFTRPGQFKVLFGDLSPDDVTIDESLKKIGVKTLSAVIPIHSHYDHALDSPVVAKKTGAVLIGSLSTANIGRGYHLPESQIQVVAPYEKIQLGKFQITFITSAHSPRAFFDGIITEPFAVPARASNFQMGDCFSLLIEHEGRKLLVHGSAGFIPHALNAVRADVVFLGIGTLGVQTDEYRQTYWNEVVRAVNAQRAFLIHWDNFFRPLSQNLTPQPWPIDNFKASMEFLINKGSKENVDVRIPILWQKVDPFSGLDFSR
jgi:L-ascorbate metabolism protein UlaG (beta-lactamase superfamily)